MPHFIAKVPKPQSLDSAQVDSMPYAYKLHSLKSSNLALMAMPYVYQNKSRLCFVYEITRANDVLLKGVKSLRPVPSGILKMSLQILSKHYEIVQDNLALTALKQQVDSPFLLGDTEVLAIVESTQSTAPHKRVILEIGFGSGRHILHLAKEHKDALVIGLEIHTPSIEQVLRQIEILGLENLYVSRLDARQFLCCASSGSVSEIFIHFPVPWNSAKNRRVLNAKPLQEVLRVLGDDGYLEFRTDDREYFDDVLSLAKDNAYARATYTINTKQSITSKYEARWLAQDKDIFTITITPKAKPSKVDSRESWQKCAFGFDKKLVKSTLAKVSTQDVLQPNQKHREIFAYLWEKRCFEQGFLCVQDVYVSATRDRVAFLVHFGDFQYPCTRLIVFESNSVDGYAGQYLPEPPLQNPANMQAHELFTTILESI
ncbi:tRNA (guanosine(46)-N7)-methyltransferase TrmB [Helicobacter zhangjianzhongii]|uniref:tRNA (Guanosine(46)-N7)-methyltransferase TrmB n=1 Tax=Helicobacter zhangjianzhongii TaxID=2974574 RepID=A0ACC6FU04_9HELI|nr:MULTISPECIES: tRNA (guanosine(46)-N7)-methyltransferase TrmB [unclassified Helicobacter]MDL0080638.1 tRNA (guanosine(46)-N7)-methyltransferase TrmB [Helicobacter sp. CPD2-1]MDL0082577.1 tRNA (guanosine(46)-N7)-methyltransferase TrmB [Helicobacter sp. XJK30-2]